MRRGGVYDARLDPTEGAEQAGARPVVIVSRDAINASSPAVIVVPCTTYRPGRRLYPSQVLLHAPDGKLNVDSVALGEQVHAFLHLDVEILLKRPCSTVDRAETAARTEELPRDLLSLRTVQEIAARRAHAIADRSPIVVDCFAPGWNSTQMGHHMPRFTIYDPSH